MNIKPLLVIAFIGLLSNPAYLIDNAHANYTMTISVTGEPINISGEIRVDIDISEAGIPAVAVDMQDIPNAEWTDDITPEEMAIFILSKADIAAMATSINGETIALRDGGKETDMTKKYYGASLIIGDSAQAGDSMTLKWNEATGIILDMHAEINEEGENVVIDVEYQSSDVDIYSDLSTFEKGWNEFLMFCATPLGIICLIAIAAAIIVFCIAFKVPKKVKRAIKKH